MSIKELGKVRADGGRTRTVKWDDRTGDIFVEGKPSLFGGGTMKKIGMTTKNSADAMSFAKSWLDQDRNR
jgi:hypothetical protein